MKKVVVIAGVTGAGKSKLALELSNYLDIEIINADSVSIYKELDIGSAKPNITELETIPHHLVDYLSIDEEWSVANFQIIGRKLIEEIWNRGHIPVVVGGTGLYINALIKDYEFISEETVETTETRNSNALYEIIQNYDSTIDVHPNNRKRLERLVYKIENNLMENKNKEEYVYDALVYFIQGNRELLYERINKRVLTMFDDGLKEEVLSLSKKYPTFFNYSSTQAIGYREFEEFVNGNINEERLIELIQRNTRRFAKRQITWFSHQLDSNPLQSDAINILDIVNQINEFIQK